MRFSEVDESVQIRICRVVCIFFMMSVHVNPGGGVPSLVHGGALTWLGTLWSDVLGRASVAALSFISGYLLVRTAATQPLAAFAGRRFRTLIVPMLAWNLIFCLLQLGKALLLASPEESVLLQPGTDPVAALTGLDGPTANLSLFFLRDLFVSALVVRLLVRPLARHPAPILGLLALLAVLDLTAPLIFRPQILLFVAAGAAWAWRVPTLAAGLSWRGALAAVAAMAAAALALRLAPVHDGALADPARELADLLRRGILVVAALVGSAWLCGTRARAALEPLERRIFETYLLHTTFIGLLWLPWTRLVGGPQDASYLVFFLLAPVAALAAGRAFGAACDRWPPALQLLLRGKAARPMPAEAAVPAR